MHTIYLNYLDQIYNNYNPIMFENPTVELSKPIDEQC